MQQRVQQESDGHYIEYKMHALPAVRDHVGKMVMNLQPAEKQFDLPALVIQQTDDMGRQLQ